ncbi:MAG: BA14K family protein [Methyloceanibacter sp.]
MMQTPLKAITAAALIGVGMFSMPAPAKAGWGCGWGPGLVGRRWRPSRQRARGPTVCRPPPPPVYGPAAYGPPAWSPAWYNYCAQRYRSFNPQTGYFIGPDGQPYFCR